jgi:peptidoglycan/xylan/chitin deacetylase (PgdA/CDA1 family)
MTELSQRVIDEGFRYFDWNVDSDDAGSAKTSDDVYNNVTSGISKHKKSVVLMHDFSNNNKTIDALQGIINFGKENGYVFRAITDDTEMVTHSVNN